MFAASAFAVLCLVALSRSDPLACEDLLRPLDQLDPQRLEGRRALVAGSVSNPLFTGLFSRGNSATAELSSSAGTTNISFSRNSPLDECVYASFSISLEGSSFTFDNINTTLIRTSCHDCVLVICELIAASQQHFFLFSKRRQLEQKEMEEFRAQVECLNMPPPSVMEPAKELCPEQSTSDPAPQAEEKTEGKKD